MADCNFFIIYVLMLINYTRCDFTHPIHEKVEELNNITIEMYGEIRKQYIKQDVDVEDRLMYPRGDKYKLSVLSQLWRDYYACTARLLDKLITSRQLPSVMLTVYQGAVARLQCVVCVAPGERERLTWQYAESAENHNFTQIEEHERMVLEHANLTIYNVMAEDAGVYRCQIGDSSGGVVILDVVDREETYTVVKPPESRGPSAVPSEIYNGVTFFSLWSPWSECSVCGKVGRRHRYGLCYVKPNHTMITSYTNKSTETETHGEFIDFDNNLIELFEAFPDGIPCRSQYLPDTIRRLHVVQQRSSEIMIGMCKVKCEESEPATNGTLDQNQTTVILTYSITQNLPKQPPLPARDTIYADFGQPIAIRCPGTTLRDVPILWRIGRKNLVPRDVDIVSGGRVHINSRDHLVFTSVLYRDTNLYSCWQSGNLAGSVKLVVWAGAAARCSPRGALALLLLAGAACPPAARYTLFKLMSF